MLLLFTEEYMIQLLGIDKHPSCTLSLFTEEYMI